MSINTIVRIFITSFIIGSLMIGITYTQSRSSQRTVKTRESSVKQDTSSIKETNSSTSRGRVNATSDDSLKRGGTQLKSSTQKRTVQSRKEESTRSKRARQSTEKAQSRESSRGRKTTDRSRRTQRSGTESTTQATSDSQDDKLDATPNKRGVRKTSRYSTPESNLYQFKFGGAQGECLPNTGESSNHGPGITVEQCAQKCFQDINCNYFDYDPNDGDCWTQPSCTSRDNDHYTAYEITGVGSVYNRKFSGQRGECLPNTSESSNHGPGLTLDQCADKCLQDSDCNFFDFDPIGGGCWTQPSCTSRDNDKNLAFSISAQTTTEISSSMKNIDKFETYLNNIIVKATAAKNVTESALEVFAQIESIVDTVIVIETLVTGAKDGLAVAKTIPSAGKFFTAPYSVVNTASGKMGKVKEAACDVSGKLENPQYYTEMADTVLEVTIERLTQIGEIAHQTWDYLELAKECAQESGKSSAISVSENAFNQYDEKLGIAANQLKKVDDAMESVWDEISSFQNKLKQSINPVLAKFRDVRNFLGPLQQIAGLLTNPIVIEPWIGQTAGFTSCPGDQELYGATCAGECVGYEASDGWVGTQRTAVATCYGCKTETKTWWDATNYSTGATTWDGWKITGWNENRKTKTWWDATNYSMGATTWDGWKITGWTATTNSTSWWSTSDYSVGDVTWDGYKITDWRAESCSWPFENETCGWTYWGTKTTGWNYTGTKVEGWYYSGEKENCYPWTHADFGITDSRPGCPSGFTDAGVTCIKGSLTIDIEDLLAKFNQSKYELDALGIISFVELAIDEAIEIAMSSVMGALALPDLSSYLPEYNLSFSPTPNVYMNRLNIDIDKIHLNINNSFNFVSEFKTNINWYPSGWSIAGIMDIECIDWRSKLDDADSDIENDLTNELVEQGYSANASRIANSIIVAALGEKYEEMEEEVENIKSAIDNPILYQLNKYIDENRKDCD